MKKKERKHLYQALKRQARRLEQALTTTSAVAAEPAVMQDLLLELRQMNELLGGACGLDAPEAPDAPLAIDAEGPRSAGGGDCLSAVQHLSARMASRLDQLGSSSGGSSGGSRAAAPIPTAPSSSSSSAFPGSVSVRWEFDAAASAGRIVIEDTATAAAAPPTPPAIDYDFDDLPPGQPGFAGASGRVLVCQGSSCARRGGLGVLQEVSRLARGAPQLEVLPCKCLGKCERGPALRVRQEGRPSQTFTDLRPGDAQRVFEQRLGRGGA